MDNIGHELDKIRKNKGKSQMELSDDSDVAICTLQRLLWGKKATIQNAVAVAWAMGYELILRKRK